MTLRRRKAMSNGGEILEDRAVARVIKEELGVSDKVTRTARELSDAIIGAYDKPGATFTGAYRLFNEFDYTVKALFTDYPKLSAVPEGDNESYKGVTDFSRGAIIIRGFSIRGRILPAKLREVLQHELQHVYDTVMGGTAGFLKTERDRETYTTAARQGMDESKSRDERNIGYAIYMWHKFEGRAFENGTYAFIMAQDLHFPGDERKAAKKSSFYPRLLRIREAYDFVTGNKEEATRIAGDVYGKSYRWLLRTVTASLKEARRQYGRAVVKAGKDYDWTHGGNTLITI